MQYRWVPIKCMTLDNIRVVEGTDFLTKYFTLKIAGFESLAVTDINKNVSFLYKSHQLYYFSCKFHYKDKCIILHTLYTLQHV